MNNLKAKYTVLRFLFGNDAWQFMLRNPSWRRGTLYNWVIGVENAG